MPFPPPPPPDPSALLTAARAGSKDALGELLEAYRRYLAAVARDRIDPRLMPKGDASDIVQDTFRDAQKGFDRFHGSTEEELLAWLRQILVHRVGRFARRYRGVQKRSATREVRLDPNDSIAADDPAYRADQLTPSAEAMAREQNTALHDGLNRLPEEYRRVILMRYRDGLPFEEIGRMLGRSSEAARKLWGRAVEKLREEIEGTPP